ncbi:MAG TPA: porin family protein [Williamwhitmania sp.]|nr:porin family protein [Williamwhitmania sp.]
MTNKKQTLLLILMLACSIPAFSQLEVGVRGGFLTTNRNFLPVIKSTSLASVKNYGLVFTVFGEKYLGMQTEFAMTERGYKDSLGYKHQQQMVELPLLGQVRFSYKSISLFFNIGAYAGYLLKSTDEIPTSDSTFIIQNHEFVKGIDRRFQYGLAGGPGIAFRTKHFSFQAEVRYYMGFAHLYNPAFTGMPMESRETGLGGFIGILYRIR